MNAPRPAGESLRESKMVERAKKLQATNTDFRYLFRRKKHSKNLLQELHFAVLISNAFKQMLPLLLGLVREIVDFPTRVSELLLEASYAPRLQKQARRNMSVTISFVVIFVSI